MPQPTNTKRLRQPARKSGAGADSGAARPKLTTQISGAPPPKVPTKTARVLSLLQRREGASLQELVTETGWQAHTTRAALTGLKKKGHAITSEKLTGDRRYHAGEGR